MLIPSASERHGRMRQVLHSQTRHSRHDMLSTVVGWKLRQFRVFTLLNVPARRADKSQGESVFRLRNFNVVGFYYLFNCATCFGHMTIFKYTGNTLTLISHTQQDANTQDSDKSISSPWLSSVRKSSEAHPRSYGVAFCTDRGTGELPRLRTHEGIRECLHSTRGSSSSTGVTLHFSSPLAVRMTTDVQASAL
jgi:hypothetical protein